MVLLAKLGLVLVYSSTCLVTVARARSKRAIADISAAGASQGGAKSHRLRGSAKVPSGWFGDFSFGESTYTDEGVDASHDFPALDVAHGADPSVLSSFANMQVPGVDFFHESDSGGPNGAWQTDFPGGVHKLPPGMVTGAIQQLAPLDLNENGWVYTPSGWLQDYREPSYKGDNLVGRHRASWFENSLKQLDRLGRQSTPSAGTARSYQSYLNGYKERSVNTSITCANPGCSGSSSLQLYDPATEEAHLCAVSIFVHPTDYDDDWSTEHVEYWKINGAIATEQCNPRARGCNSTAEEPLYTCVNALSVDRLVNSGGAVVLEGKNSPFVDDCPDNGNLLSAIAIGTCLVRNRVDTTTTTTTNVYGGLDAMHAEGILNCSKQGCSAETTLEFIPAIALNGGTCAMSVNVTQTDYDDAGEGIIEFAVQGKNMTSGLIKPGKNPCTMKFQGTDPTDADRIYAAVTSFDVTDLVKNTHPLGTLKVTGSITPKVDECGYEGNLLYAKVYLDCTPATTTT